MYLSPKSGMDDVESFEVFFVFVFEDVVHFPHPFHRRVVVSFRQRVEIEDDVVAFDQGFQQRYQIQQGLSYFKKKSVLSHLINIFVYFKDY